MGKSRIKGLTVEIGGSTTGLEKALGKVNKSVSSSQAKLRDLNKLLKLDPHNTELLSQKQRTLKDAISATKDKLEVLKKAQKDAEEQLKNGDIGQDQYDALSREIIECEQALKALNKEAKNVPSALQANLQAASEGIKDVGGKIQDVGKTVTMGVTAPIAGAAGASIAAWKEVDEAMDIIVKKTGASGDALKDMQDRAKALAETMPTDFNTAANAVGEVNTRFGLTGQELEDLSAHFIEFAKLNETDVSSSIDSVQSAMEAWNIPAEKAGLVLDTINKAGQDTGISVDKLTDLMKTNKTALDEAGLSFSDSAMFLANLDKNGIDAGVALTGLKKALQNATKDGKSSRDALSELQQTMGEGANKADAYAAASELFGAKVGPAIADACMEGRLSFEELGTALEDFQGNVFDAFEQTVSPMDDLQMSMNRMKDLGYDIVETAAPMIEEGLAMLRDTITELKEKWDSLDEGQQQNIIKFAGMAAVIGPVIVVIGTLIGAIGGVVTGIGAAIGVIGAISAPVMIAVGVIGLLIAAGVALYKNWDEIKAFAGRLWSGLQQTWSDIKTGTVETFTNIKDGTIQRFEDMRSGAEQRVQELKDSAVGKITELADDAAQRFENFKENAMQKAQDIRDAVVQPFENMAETAGQKFEDLKTGVQDKLNSAWEFSSGIADSIKNVFDFDWKLPELKLPHIVVGGYIDVPVLGRIPDPDQVYVDWYAKAMSRGVILDSPTIFGMQNGQLLGGGEAGPEAVVGVNSLQSMITQAVQAAQPIQTVNYGGIEIIVNAPAGMDIRTLANEIEARISHNVMRRKAGFA